MKRKLVVWTTTNLLKWGLLLFFIEGIIVTVMLLGVPSDPKNAVLLGMSSGRIIYFTLFVLIDLLLLWLMRHFFRGTTFSDRIVSTLESIIMTIALVDFTVA